MDEGYSVMCVKWKKRLNCWLIFVRLEEQFRCNFFFFFFLVLCVFCLALLSSLFRCGCDAGGVIKATNRHQSDMFRDAVRCVLVFRLACACVSDPSPRGQGKRLVAPPPTSGPWGLQSQADKLGPVFSPQDPNCTDPFNYVSSREHLIRPLTRARWWNKRSGFIKCKWINIVGLMY